MSAAEWVRERNSGAPRELLRSMGSALENAEGATPVAQLTSAARTLARRVALEGCADRSRALDLLTLDALVTTAMEAGATDARACEATASSLLAAISDAAAIE